MLYTWNEDEQSMDTLVRVPQTKSGALEVAEGVKAISDDALDGCTGVTSVSIPSSVVSIGEHSFDYLSKLASIKVNSNNTAYSSNEGVLFAVDGTLLKYPEGKKGDYIVPNTTTAIGAGAFARCVELENIALPTGVTYIGDNAFNGCTGLQSIIIENNVKSVGVSAFEGCSKLEEIILEEGITSIGKKAFSGCSGLKTISIPTSVQTIEECAFCDTGLEEVVIPSGVETIGEHPFEGCEKLKKIEVDEDNTNFSSKDGVLLDIDGTTIVQFPKGWVGEYVIPETVSALDGKTFVNCRYLTSVTIPELVASVEKKMFAGCSSLTAINVDERNNELKSIDGMLLNKKYSLLEFPEGRTGRVDIPVGVYGIESEAFKDCIGVTAISLPETITEMGSNAFQGCKSLEVISYPNDFDPFFFGEGEYPLNGCDSLHHICVGVGFFNDLFCGRTEFCETDSCEALTLDGNHCYEESCYRGEVVQQKRANATEYEEKLHACVDYICDINLGPVTRSMCNSTLQQRRICQNDGCLAFGSEIRVEVSVESGIFAGDVDLDQLNIQVASLTGVQNFNVGIELDSQAFVVRVVVIVQQNEDADAVYDAVQSIDKGEGCEYGILCRSNGFDIMKSSRYEMSAASKVYESTLIALFVMMIIALVQNEF